MCKNCHPTTEMLPATLEAPKPVPQFHRTIESYSIPAGTLDGASLELVYRYVHNRFFGIGEGNPAWKEDRRLNDVSQRLTWILNSNGFRLNSLQREELLESDDAWEAKAKAARAHGKEPAVSLESVRTKLAESLIAGVKKTDSAELPSLVAIIEAIGDFWMIKGTHEYVGSFSKRLGRFLHKQGITLSPEHLQEIGNIASAGLTRSNTARLDFTSRINWSAGDFGDSGSCYWSCRKGAKGMIQDNDGKAIRAYGDNGKGIGRCWIAPLDSSAYVLWNAYGPISLWDYARLISHKWGMSYKKVTLENNGSAEGELWINGGLGIIVAPIDRIDDYGNAYDLEWEELPGCECHECGTGIDEEDAYLDPNGNPLCESCYRDNYTSCRRCGETFANDEVAECDNRWLCEYCADQAGYHRCDNCNEMSRDTSETDCGNTWCDECLTSLPFCEECEMYLETGDTRETVDSRCVCEECCGKMEQCEECNRYAPPESLETVVNEVVGDSVCRCGECHSEARRHRLEQTLALPFPDETVSAHEATAHTQELLSIGM